MPIHRGPRLNDDIARLLYAQPIAANLIQCWPHMAAGISITGGSPGSWYEMVSQANAPSQRFVTAAVTMGGQYNATQIEMGYGAAGSEVAAAAGLANGDKTALGYLDPIFPVAGPQRIAFRGTGSVTAYLLTLLCPPPLAPGAALRWTPKVSSFYSAKPTALYQTAIAATGAAWANPGTWTDLTTGLAGPFLITGIVHGGGDQDCQAELAYGATPTIFATIPMQGTAGYPFHLRLPFPIYVPPSTRLTVRNTTFTGSAYAVRSVGVSGIPLAVFP